MTLNFIPLFRKANFIDHFCCSSFHLTYLWELFPSFYLQRDPLLILLSLTEPLFLIRVIPHLTHRNTGEAKQRSSLSFNVHHVYQILRTLNNNIFNIFWILKLFSNQESIEHFWVIYRIWCPYCDIQFLGHNMSVVSSTSNVFLEKLELIIIAAFSSGFYNDFKYIYCWMYFSLQIKSPLRRYTASVAFLCSVCPVGTLCRRNELPQWKVGDNGPQMPTSLFFGCFGLCP